MKLVITVGYKHYVVSAATGVAFLQEAQEVEREYDGKTGYTYKVLSPDKRSELEVKAIDPNAVLPSQEAPNA